IERRRIAGVLEPVGRTGIGMVRNRERRLAISARMRESVEPADPGTDRRSWRAQEQDALTLREGDEGICLGHGRRDPLLAVAGNTGVEGPTVCGAGEGGRR